MRQRDLLSPYLFISSCGNFSGAFNFIESCESFCMKNEEVWGQKIYLPRTICNGSLVIAFTKCIVSLNSELRLFGLVLLSTVMFLLLSYCLTLGWKFSHCTQTHKSYPQMEATSATPQACQGELLFGLVNSLTCILCERVRCGVCRASHIFQCLHFFKNSNGSHPPLLLLLNNYNIVYTVKSKSCDPVSWELHDLFKSVITLVANVKTVIY